MNNSKFYEKFYEFKRTYVKLIDNFYLLSDILEFQTLSIDNIKTYLRVTFSENCDGITFNFNIVEKDYVSFTMLAPLHAITYFAHDFNKAKEIVEYIYGDILL